MRYLSILVVFAALTSQKALAANVVMMNNLTRTFNVITNAYDVGAVGGKTYTDLAVVAVPAGYSNLLDSRLAVSTNFTAPATTKALPWSSPFEKRSPANWTALPSKSNDTGLRFWIDLSTPLGKSMYTALVAAQQSRYVISVAIDYDLWIYGVGYKLQSLEVIP